MKLISFGVSLSIKIMFTSFLFEEIEYVSIRILLLSLTEGGFYELNIYFYISTASYMQKFNFLRTSEHTTSKNLYCFLSIRENDIKNKIQKSLAYPIFSVTTQSYHQNVS